MDFFLVLCHKKPQEDIRLWHDGGEERAGFAMLGEDPSIDWQVLPEYEWTGIEEEALAWAEMRVAELRRNDPGRSGDRLVSVSPADDVLRIAFLARHGFTYGGKFAEVNTVRALDGPLPDALLPAGFQVRALAKHGEELLRSAAEREVWLPYTVGNISGGDYAALMQLPGYDRELDIMAVGPDGVIAACANCWLDPASRIGDFGPVGALPAYRRRAWGRAVIVEGLRRMQAAGMDRACVSTTHTNTAARSLYESIGFRIVNRSLDYVKYNRSTVGRVRSAGCRSLKRSWADHRMSHEPGAVMVVRSIAKLALLVRDYDEAITFLAHKLRFSVVEDAPLGAGKRGVVVAPPGGHGASLLLARAADPEQAAHFGNQTGGRVFLFLQTGDFWHDYQEMLEKGVQFAEEPREEPYGLVAVFYDLYGNRWDLLLPSQGNSLCGRR